MARRDTPSTVARSSAKAVRTWEKTHDSAVEEYGEGERAHRTAFSSLKHSFEKVGDHWEEKAEKGPSDSQAAAPRGTKGVTTHAGVDATASKSHLMDLAKRLEIPGRSSMTKAQLVEALEKESRRETARRRA